MKPAFCRDSERIAASSFGPASAGKRRYPEFPITSASRRGCAWESWARQKIPHNNPTSVRIPDDCTIGYALQEILAKAPLCSFAGWLRRLIQNPQCTWKKNPTSTLPKVVSEKAPVRGL